MPNLKSRHLKSLVSSLVVAVICLLVAAMLLLHANDYEDNKATFAPSGEVCDDFVRFFDVGQGDSALITSNGRSVLIDTGTPESADSLCSKIKKAGVEKQLEAVVLSHFHDDHSGGIDAVTSRFSVNNLVFPDMLKSDSVLSGTQNAKRTVLAEEGEVYLAKQGMTLTFGDCTLTVLAYYDSQQDENNRSLFIMAEINGKKFLFPGDAQRSAENMILEEGLNLKCDVLKVGHHGSNSSASQVFLNACKPKYAVICCGAGNIYGHPGEDTISRLSKNNITVARTDINEDITFSVFSDGILMETER